MSSTILFSIITVLFGFAILIKGADSLIKGSVHLAARIGISELLIGLTIVAFGTSLPELVVNLFANNEQTAGLAIGNIVGSNIANIFLILGIAAFIHPIKVQRITVWREVLISVMAGIVLVVLVSDSLLGLSDFSGLDKIDGAILISYFVAFLYYSFGHAQRLTENPIENKDSIAMSSTMGLIIFGALGLTIGGNFIVSGSSNIAMAFGVDSGLIGLSLVALGTSAPELAATIVAVRQRKTDIAVGNIVGSNLFNTFWVLGLSALIRPLPFDSTQFGDALIAAFAGIMLFAMMAFGPGRHVIGKPTGVIFLSSYGIYLIYLATRLSA